MAKDRQRLFAEEFTVDFNATQAAIRAGYSEKTAGSIGSENLKKPEIQKMIDEALRERIRRTHITQDRVVLELAAVAFADAADCTDSTLKYSNKIKALELLGKHLGMFRERAADGGEESAGVVMLAPVMDNPGPPGGGEDG